MDAQKEQTGDAFLRQGAEQRQSALYGICPKDKIFIYGGLKLQVQLSKQMLEELLPGPVTKEQFTDIFDHFRKAFIERVMQAEMSHHLGYGVGEAKPEGVTNQRNGSSFKTIISDSGAIRTEVPRFT